MEYFDAHLRIFFGQVSRDQIQSSKANPYFPKLPFFGGFGRVT